MTSWMNGVYIFLEHWGFAAQPKLVVGLMRLDSDGPWLKNNKAFQSKNTTNLANPKILLPTFSLVYTPLSPLFLPHVSN